MNKVIKSIHNNLIQKLSEDGYVVVDFLNPLEIEILKNHFLQNSNKIDAFYSNGIHMTTWIDNNDLKIKIKNELESFLKKSCETLFENFKLLNTTYIVKKKHKISNFPIHQDWSFVDENNNEAINLWIALQDTSTKNGGLYVIKGSHQLNNTIRGSGKLSFNFEQFRNQLNPYLTPVHLKAGQAILFYYSLLHGSPSNFTEQNRIIIASSVVPENADIIINYFNESKNSLEQYKMDDNFIYQYKNIREESVTKPPDGKLINEIINYIPKIVTLNVIKKIGQKNERSIFYKLQSIFKYWKTLS